MNEFNSQIRFEDDSIEEFKVKISNGFIGPALLGTITALMGGLVLTIILLH